MFVYVPPTPSAQARELGEQVAQTVRSYRAEHPGLSSADVGQALRLARESLGREAGGSSAVARMVMISLGLGVLALGATLLLVQGGAAPNVSAMVLVALVVLGVLAVLLARR